MKQSTFVKSAALAALIVFSSDASAQSTVQNFNHTPTEMKEAAKRASAPATPASSPAPGDPAANAAKDAATEAAKNEANRRSGGILGGFNALKNSKLGQAVEGGIRNATTDGAKGVPVLIREDVAAALKNGPVAVLLGSVAQSERLKSTLDASKGKFTIIVVDADMGGKRNKDVADAITAISEPHKDKGSPLVMIYTGSDAQNPVLVENAFALTTAAVDQKLAGPAQAAPSNATPPANGGRRDGMTPANPPADGERQRVRPNGSSPRADAGDAPTSSLV